MTWPDDVTCDLCGLERFPIDHDHDHNCCDGPDPSRFCGTCWRGYVCRSCNLSLGHFERGRSQKDDAWQELAKAYLARYAERRRLLEALGVPA
jgi:hypothetical protein